MEILTRIKSLQEQADRLESVKIEQDDLTRQIDELGTKRELLNSLRSLQNDIQTLSELQVTKAQLEGERDAINSLVQEIETESERLANARKDLNSNRLIYEEISNLVLEKSTLQSDLRIYKSRSNKTVRPSKVTARSKQDRKPFNKAKMTLKQGNCPCQ